jgi:hypothetical protein
MPIITLDVRKVDTRSAIIDAIGLARQLTLLHENGHPVDEHAAQAPAHRNGLAIISFEDAPGPIRVRFETLRTHFIVDQGSDPDKIYRAWVMMQEPTPGAGRRIGP